MQNIHFSIVQKSSGSKKMGEKNPHCMKAEIFPCFLAFHSINVSCGIRAPSTCFSFFSSFFPSEFQLLIPFKFLSLKNFTGINLALTLQDIYVLFLALSSGQFCNSFDLTPKSAFQKRSLLLFCISAPPAGPHQLLNLNDKIKSQNPWSSLNAI